MGEARGSQNRNGSVSPTSIVLVVGLLLEGMPGDEDGDEEEGENEDAESSPPEEADRLRA
jgi:hypothetical protein